MLMQSQYECWMQATMTPARHLASYLQLARPGLWLRKTLFCRTDWSFVHSQFPLTKPHFKSHDFNCSTLLQPYCPLSFRIPRRCQTRLKIPIRTPNGSQNSIGRLCKSHFKQNLKERDHITQQHHQVWVTVVPAYQQWCKESAWTFKRNEQSKSNQLINPFLWFLLVNLQINITKSFQQRDQQPYSHTSLWLFRSTFLNRF